ncbi:MAG: ferritin-like domain-containing protein [Candidatus Tectimicrobiota bacterium]
MQQKAPSGSNQTGISTAPERSQAMLAGMEEFPPNSQGSAQDIAQVRIAYATTAEPIGSVPRPAGMKGKVQTAIKTVLGEQPTLFMDKLGERLAFERTGTRLYEALIAKHEAFGSFAGGPSKADLEHILDEEYQHFLMLQTVIERLGGDPTAVTPSANLSAVASQGIPQVLVDPRTTLLQSLEAIMIAELADHACWEALVEFAQQAGETDLAQQFEQALTTEQEHLIRVQTWLAAGQGRDNAGSQQSRQEVEES